MTDMDNWNEGRKQRWQARMERHRRHGSAWTGIFILLIGVAGLLKVSIPELPTWLFSWPMFLIFLGIFIGIRERFAGGAWFILILIGGAFLITLIIPDINLHRYIWPMAMIIVGAFFILRPRRRHWTQNWAEKKTAGVPDSSSGMSEEGTASEEDFIDSTAIFGGAHKIILSKDFKGGDIVNIFGGTELNLTQADIKEKAVLEMTTVFGGTKLILPSNWSVKSEATIIFGGLEDKRAMPSTPGPTTKVLLLKGTVIFGGIEIKNF